MDVTPASYSDGAGSKFGTGIVVTDVCRGLSEWRSNMRHRR
jgi:hypothetical protein